MNRALRIDSSADQLYYTIPCGECTECRKQKQQEIALRCYYEYLYAKQNSGYSYFETFTYNPESLPVYKKIPCFDPSHYTQFMNILRKRMSKLYPQCTLRHFWVSEYGGKTNRPHYHAIFFLSGVCPSPLDFRNLIASIWSFKGVLPGQSGRGKRMKGLGLGFIDHIQTVNSRVIYSTAALRYVSKYVTKDQSYYSRISKPWLSQAAYDKLRLSFKPFHRQSLGFGECMINMIGKDVIKERGYIFLPTSKGNQKVSIPMYIKRKLFYKLTKFKIDGKEHLSWQLTKEGKEWKQGLLKDSISRLTDRFNTIFENLESYQIPEVLEGKTLKTYISNLLGTRTLRDFATYLLVYKDRFILTRPITLSKDLDPSHFYSQSLSRSGTKFTNRLLQKEHKSLFGMFPGTPEFSDILISQRTCPEFTHFDDLLLIFNLILNPVRESTEKVEQTKLDIHERLKLIL